MTIRKIIFINLLLLTGTFSVIAKPKDPLLQCWNKQVKALHQQYIVLAFQEKFNQLEHSFEPWQQTNYVGKGKVWINATDFLKHDTLSSGNRVYNSKTQFRKGELLFLDHGDNELYPVTKGMVEDQVVKAARYSPATLINFFYQHAIAADKPSTKEEAVYRTTINKTIVTLTIRKSDNLLVKITTLHDDELFGDVETVYSLKDYAAVGEVHYPKQITITKINGKINDEVNLSAASLTNETPTLLTKPEGYIIKDDVATTPEIKYEKYNTNIHFLELKHTDDRVLIVEFKDFVLIAEAPVNSKNGELILDEVNKIAPGKPVKYFVFGHYHPHYIGGMRPFVHAGAEVISTVPDKEYVKYLASAPHTLNPDKLQTQPKELKQKELRDSLTITDGELEMKIYFIGKQSEHTNDYLIYYFPKEKLLFEDDLVWIAREGEIKKAGRRQAGLYKAVKALGLAVDTIIQSWPVKDYGVKTIIPFADLEKSMK